MERIHDDLLPAFYGAGIAAGTFVIVDHRMVLDDGYSTLRTYPLAFAAADTSITAGGTYHILFFLCR